jgi:histidinol dehydrogenase
MPTYLKQVSSALGNQSAPKLDVPNIVKTVIDDIRSKGDAAVRSYSEEFDKWSPASFKLSKDEIESIISKVSTQTIEDIKTVQHNVRTFALAQRKSINDFEMEIRPGVHLGQKNIPIASVGAYGRSTPIPFVALLTMEQVHPRW